MTSHPDETAAAGLHARIDALKSKFDFEGRRQHAYNKIDWLVPKSLRGRFLDIGCGPGNGVVAALQHGFQMAVGIDRDLHEFSVFDLTIDQLCGAYGVDASRALLVRADIDRVAFNDHAFDFVLLLDSIEHVPSPAKFIRYAADRLSENGVVVLDTCPLYFSKAGAHLFSQFDPAAHPWVHLRHDFQDLLLEQKVDDWSMQRFHELNKVTHDDLVAAFADCGLEVVSSHRATPKPEDIELLARHRHLLNLDGVPDHLLFEDWVLLVGRKAA